MRKKNPHRCYVQVDRGIGLPECERSCVRKHGGAVDSLTRRST